MVSAESQKEYDESRLALLECTFASEEEESALRQRAIALEIASKEEDALVDRAIRMTNAGMTPEMFAALKLMPLWGEGRGRGGPLGIRRWGPGEARAPISCLG